MNIKKVEGTYWIRDQIKSIGSYESLACLKIIIKELDDGIIHGAYLPDIDLEITDEEYSRHSYMKFYGYRIATGAEVIQHEKWEMSQAILKDRSKDLEKQEYERLKRIYEKEE